MRALLVIVVFVLGCANQSVFGQRQFVTLTNVRAEYKSLTEVKPVLTNAGHQSVYLWPQECGEVLVSYFLGEYWYDSDRKPCPARVRPIKIAPGRSYHVPNLIIRIERDEGQFIEERLGKPGAFKISVSYSFKPVYRNGPPQLKETASREFRLVQ